MSDSKTGDTGTYIVAEMACSHDGDAERAWRITEGAAQAGANAVQFQIWSVSDVVAPDHPAIERLKSLEISRESWAKLFHKTREAFPHLDLWACVYDRRALVFCAELGFSGYKIHFSEISNVSLLAALAQTRQPLHVCVGGATANEITAVIDELRNLKSGPVTLLHGIQLFPTKVADARLSYLRTLQTAYGLPVGFQDHSCGDSAAAFWLPAAALGVGATVLEKHITDDRSRRGADFESALEPTAFAQFVAMIRDLDRSLGDGSFRPLSAVEQKYRLQGRRVLFARRKIAEGESLSEDDLLSLKSPKSGLTEGDKPSVVGKRTKRVIDPYEAIQLEDLS